MSLQTGEAKRRLLRVVKISHWTYFALILLAAIFLLVLLKSNYKSIYVPDDPKLIVIEVIFGLFAIICITIGFCWQRIARRQDKTTFSDIMLGHILRISFFESLAAYGVSLGMLGSRWYTLFPFFALAFISLILTYPTDGYFRSWIGNLRSDH